MHDPLSVEDLFVVGVSFDLLGGYYLGRGLFATPGDIVRRTTSLYGQGLNPAEAISQIRARADGWLGLGSLAIGFVLQAAGYIVVISGATVSTGLARALVALVLAAALGAGAWRIARAAHRKLVHWLVIAVASEDPMTGRRDDRPDAATLVSLGQHLGLRIAEIRDGDINAAYRTYAKTHFGVEVFDRRPPEFPAAE